MLLFFFGKDCFRSTEKVLEIKNKFTKSDKSGAGLSSFDAEEEKSLEKKLSSAIQASGLFSVKRLVILKKVITHSPLDEQKKILEYLKKNAEKISTDNDVVLLFWENDQPRKNNALFRFLFSHAKKQAFEKLNGPQLEQWIRKKIQSLEPQASISREALQKLILYAGDDSALLSQEIEKLLNFSSTPQIEVETVELLTKDGSEETIFATIEALSVNKKAIALSLLEKHFAQGADPFYLLSMFLFQFRNLLRISALGEMGIFQEGEISRQTKLHPFVVKKGVFSAKILGQERLQKAYTKLAQIDAGAKTGLIDLRLALSKFIAEL